MHKILREGGIINKGQTLNKILTHVILLVIIIPMVISYSYFIFTNFRDNSEDFDEISAKTLYTIDDKISDFDREIRSSLRFVRTNYIVQNYVGKEKELLNMIRKYNELHEYQDIAFGTDEGKMFTSDKTVLIKDYDPRLRPWYVKSVIDRGNVIVTTPYRGPRNNDGLYISYGVTVEKDGDILGVIAIDVKMNRLLDSLNELSIDKEKKIFIIDENNNVILERNESDGFEFSIREEYGFELIDTRDKIEKIDFKGDTFRFDQRKIADVGWKIVVLTPRDLIFSQFSGSFYLIILVGAILTFLVIRINKNVERILISPIRDIIDNINNIKDGKAISNSDYPSSTPVEVVQIKDAIIQMDEEIKESTEILISQKQEINGQYEEINSLYEETTAMNETLNELLSELEENYKLTVTSLSNAIEANDAYTRGHCDRVRKYSVKIGEALKLSESKLNNLQYCAILHDIGKVGIPSEILNKNDKLTDVEFDVIKKHPEIGYNILKGIPFLKASSEIILQHHERFDGNGYPNRLKGEEIHQFARIISVVDAYDAMTSSRPYRTQPLSNIEAINQLEINKNTQFDSEIVDVFIDILAREQE